mmetsp:Transcript_10779/g.14993  ORF Transcript_10779/g.14993 Transcript_10779/m.14993 type:complete len:209 (-) Transcript_10779:858-1484(-)
MTFLLFPPPVLFVITTPPSSSTSSSSSSSAVPSPSASASRLLFFTALRLFTWFELILSPFLMFMRRSGSASSLDESYCSSLSLLSRASSSPSKKFLSRVAESPAFSLRAFSRLFRAFVIFCCFSISCSCFFLCLCSSFSSKARNSFSIATLRLNNFFSFLNWFNILIASFFPNGRTANRPETRPWQTRTDSGRGKSSASLIACSSATE